MTSGLELLPWLASLGLAPIGFVFGKIFAQSEKILDHKRSVYEAFLERCPAPQEAHTETDFSDADFQRTLGLLTLYGSQDVLQFAGEYFDVFSDAQSTLIDVATPGHPKFIEVMSYYNRMVWAMRVDATTWSVFSPVKKARKYSQGTFKGH